MRRISPGRHGAPVRSGDTRVVELRDITSLLAVLAGHLVGSIQTCETVQIRDFGILESAMSISMK
jgi:hypothetical protein